ncbi:GNAT family N-acetyltransferase [Clostridiaceae bacterium NSJ-33]|uniref:GNAT family N-acetyltransferase n=1 Tax=Fumia xinanensis TaxID=2763659 RepID=A0A926E3V9_9FIRM|nr:GNAT family N-acetyltransferase [Fumia xinanensis]
MRELYRLLPQKPDWLTEQDIDNYEHRMKTDEKSAGPENRNTDTGVPKSKQKNDLASRNYRTFAKLFPDIVSQKYSYLRLESEGFEPLSLEWLSGKELSMMHTYTQNGDLMRDPDMVLRIDSDTQTIQAVSYELSSMGIYQEVFTEGGYRPKLQKELNSFLSNWLSNIASQGYESVRAVEMVDGEEREITFDVVEEPAPEQELALSPLSVPNFKEDTEQLSLFPSENEGRYLDESEKSTEAAGTETVEPNIDEGIKILDEMIDAHNGQIDMEMTIYKGEIPVGFMQYSVYEGVPKISMIEILPEYRRQGYATRLLRYLQKQYPDVEIEWGLLTEDGKALYDAITFSIENPDFVRAKNDLEDIIAEYKKYDSVLNNGGILSSVQSADMDDLEDIQYRLENELRELRPTRVFVRLDEDKMNGQLPGTESEPSLPDEDAKLPASISPEPVPQNFRYTAGMDLYPRGEKSKYQANVTAIKLLRQIEAERRPSHPRQRSLTREEQIVLARYCGWGGLSNVFNEKSDGWSKEYQELKSLLTPEEYKAAMESTLTAYYTDPELIKYIYKAVESFGFTGGPDRKILDPATGTGNFFSVLPESLYGTKLYGTEIDSITGRIARLLYPEADIQVKGFESAQYEDNSFDVCIGNIPFNSIKVYDYRYKDEDFLIHDYFIAKSIDLTKPGGIIAYITTKGTMDKGDSSVRKYIARRAEFIGALRLPNTAFKAIAGTEVTSDIIFLKKRAQPIEFSDQDYPDWIKTELERAPKWIAYNLYFHRHPEMILGEMQRSKNMYGRDDGTACIAPEGYDLYAEMEKAIGNLKATFEAKPNLPPAKLPDEIEEKVALYMPAPEGTKNYTYQIIENKIFFCEKNELIPQPYTGKKAERIKGLCEIRTALLDVISIQSHPPYAESELKDKQAVLNEVYDRFVKKHGVINSKGNILVFSDDDQFPLLRSIENEVKEKDGTVRWEKAQIFSKATIHPRILPDHCDTAEEALYLSLNTRLKIDLGYMFSLTGKEPHELIEELGDKVYLNPRSYYGNILEGWETAEEYLSGNVRDKLLYAKIKAEEAPDLFTRNVTALEAIQPAPLKPADIDTSIGTPWIPIEYYQQFMYETFETAVYNRATSEERYNRNRITLEYMEYTTAWYINGKTLEPDSVQATKTYGTERKNAYEIYEDCLNQKSATVRDKVEYRDPITGQKKEKYVINTTETRIARAKQSQIKEAFAAWIWKDAKRRDTLLKIYNDRFNVFVPRQYDGSHLIFPGMSEEEKLRPHQADFAARVIYSGTGLAAHEVGAGKTAALIAAGMFLKNLGAIQKPVYVVPNPLVGQWATEFYRFFPNANLLVSTVEDFSAKNRNRYVSRIAMGDYDAVILAHSQFERIPISAKRQAIQIQEQINQISYAIERAKEEKGENWTVKQMVRFKMNLEANLEKLSAEEKKDDLLSFEELGIDFMFVDEAHMYKNCFVYTKLSRVAGINTSSSQRAYDMMLKCQYLQSINNGRGVVFATGTPISNSMSELYVMMRYLEPNVLRDLGVADFDSWAATFGRIVSSLEITPEGGGWRMRQRFSKFVNLPELMQAFRLVADIQTADMLHLSRPAIKGGRAEVISTDATEYQKKIMEEFVQRAEAIRTKRVDPREDNMLKLTGEARLMAIDPRLIDKTAPNDPQTKLNFCINNLYRVWEDTAADRLTQLVFCDVSTPGAKDVIEMQEVSEGKFEMIPGQFVNVYHEIKMRLMERGVPGNEIAFIHDAKSEAQRQAIFEQMRSGEIRILLGSTGKLGTGVNVQDRVIALHHLDVPWKPSDITQRDGRGLRQGNINPEIMIFHYITVGTFDAYLWQIQQQKLSYITQIMTGKCIARSCEDIDETVLNAAQFKAIATDNPQLLIKMELENRVSELRLLQRNHENEQSELERLISRTYPAQIAQHEKNIMEISADVDSLKQTEGKDFSIVLEGKTYDERGKAGELLLLYVRMLKDSKDKERLIGEYRGFTLSVYKDTWFFPHIQIAGEHKYCCDLGETAIGTISRLENLTERIPQYLKAESLDLESVKGQLESAKKQYGAPFPYEAELSEKSAQLSEVETELELGKDDSEEIIMDENEDGAENTGNCSAQQVSVCAGAEI